MAAHQSNYVSGSAPFKADGGASESAKESFRVCSQRLEPLVFPPEA